MNNKQGFTLIELLTVVLIIGILTALGLPQYNKVVERSTVTEAESMLRIIYDSSERLAGEFGYRSYSQLFSAKGNDPAYSFARLDMFDPAKLPAGCAIVGDTMLECRRFSYKIDENGYVAAKKINGRKYVDTYILLDRHTMRLSCQPSGADPDGEACDIYNLPINMAGVAF